VAEISSLLLRIDAGMYTFGRYLPESDFRRVSKFIGTYVHGKHSNWSKFRVWRGLVCDMGAMGLSRSFVVGVIWSKRKRDCEET
jgi:hypothetical protein